MNTSRFFVWCVGFFFLTLVCSTPVLAVTSQTVGKIRIDSGNAATHDRRVTLSITVPTNAKEMMLSNSAGFEGGTWEKSKTRKSNWYLEYGARSHSVFVKFRLKNGTVTAYVYDTISLSPATPAVSISVPDGTVTDRYIVVSTTLSNGIESYRYGVTKDLSKQAFDVIRDRETIPIILSAGDGKKVVYIDFQDASGKILQKNITISLKQVGRSIAEGSVLYGQDKKYYYYGYDGRLHMFPNEQVLRSWYPESVAITSVSRSKIEEYAQGSAMCVRPGTYLVRFGGSTQVYMPDVGCRLRPFRSEAEAFMLFGSNWRARILDLSSAYFLHYDVVVPNVKDVDPDAKDKDKDGVSEEIEGEYGTSDRRDDSDGDGLSDYEEIEYWFSDPLSMDSDSDGYKDMQEILNGFNPIGENKLSRVPANTYTYPSGTVMRPKTPTKKPTLYYIRTGSITNTLSGQTNSNSFVLNYFQSKFIAEPPLPIGLPTVKGSVSNKRDLAITEPLVFIGGDLKKL